MTTDEIDNALRVVLAAIGEKLQEASRSRDPIAAAKVCERALNAWCLAAEGFANAPEFASARERAARRWGQA